MNISLSAEVARLVERELESGRYASASDLVGESLLLLERERAMEDEELDLLRSAVAAGLADAEAGRFSDKSVEDILAEVLSETRR